MRKLVLAFVIGLFMSSGAWAQDYEKGKDAYEKGDYATALTEFLPLAEEGDARSQYNLWLMYYHGFGVTKDEKEALKWFKLSLEHGNAEVEFSVGLMFFYGNNDLPLDYEKAIDWFRRSAKKGFAEAQFKLGFVHEYGAGVIQNYREAVKWYKLAAEQGHTNAQYYLGSMYLSGRGISQDNTLAHMWFNIAASKHHELAIKARYIAAEEMTLLQIEEAQGLAQECIEKDYKGC